MEHIFQLPSESDFEDFLNENKEWYYNTCFTQVSGSYHNQDVESVEIVTIRFEDTPESEYFISVNRDDYDLNLSYCLTYFEEVEDYEKCSQIHELINSKT